MSRVNLEPSQPLVEWIIWPECETSNSRPASAEFENELSLLLRCACGQKVLGPLCIVHLSGTFYFVVFVLENLESFCQFAFPLCYSALEGHTVKWVKSCV